MTIDNYVRFDAVEFLKDSKRWDSRERELKKQLDGIPLIPGNGILPGRSKNNTSDTVSSAVIKRQKIADKLQEIEYYRKALSRTLEALTEAQNEALAVFFFSDGLVSNNVDLYSQKYGVCRSHVYKARREALEEFSRIITSKYL